MAAVLFFGVWLFFWVGYSFVLLFKPHIYLKWMNVSWKWWGVRLVVDDEPKFVRSCRFVGILFVGASLAMGIAIVVGKR